MSFYLASIIQVSGTPTNIVKPFTSLDTTCQLHNVKTNSLYNDSGMSVDNAENSIENNDKGEMMKNSPAFTLELNSSSCHISKSKTVSLLLLLTFVLCYL
jgi:hypothetical protein